MKKRSMWLAIGLLIVSVVFTLAGCRKKKEISYELSDTEIVLTVGQQKVLTVSPETDKEIIWQSSDAGVATVENGTVTAIGVGNATVTVTISDGKNPLTCSVKVEKKPDVVEKEYHLDLSSVDLKTGETKQLSVYDDADNAVQSVTYSSADPSVATVSASGLITAVAPGETAVKAKVGSSELTCTVTVRQKYTYSLDKTVLDIAAGANEKITLIMTPANSENTRPHTFSSSDTSVATVDGGSGKVTGIGKGTATITCLVDGDELTATVTVTEYTVKVGDEAFTDETTLRVGVEKDITVTADPTREISAVYASGDETIVTVTDGHLVPLEAGTTTVTVTVGGREFKTTVTVLFGVIYTINHEEVTLNMGATNNTVQLEVTRDPEGEFAVTFESSDTSVASVNANGLVTAVGLGTATITTKVTGTDVEFTTEVSVVLSSSLAHDDYTFGSGAVNLTRLDANKTLDWRQFNGDDNNPTRMKNNANLIGNYDKGANTDEHFWDYKAPVLTEDGEGDKSGVSTYGIAVHGSYTIPVMVNNTVSKVVILTGAWKESATIEFKVGNTVLQAEAFAGANDALARKYELTLDTSALADGESLELTIAVKCNRSNGGNVSLVAVAVIGKTAHEQAVTATSSAQVTTGLTGEQNVTEAGSIDWIAAYETTKKAGVPADAVINVSGIEYGKNPGTAQDYPGATLNWTDGTAAAPGNCRTFRFADDFINIFVRLEKGKSTVTVFASGYNCGYLVAVYDKNGNFVNAYQGADEKQGQSVSSKIEIALDVAESGTYTFKIMKCRGAGNSGWAAIAVSGANDFEPAQYTYDMSKGDTANVTLVGTGTAPAATYTSGNAEVATVDANGAITAIGAGSTYITVSYANAERRVFVTVTEYNITSATSVDLFIGGTSKITLASNPAGHTINATYHLADGEDKISVSADGVITARKAGEASVTVKVDGKTIGTVTVTIANYTLNETSHTIVTASGTSTFKLEVIDPATDSAVTGATFSVEDDSIVTVAQDGTITAVGVGKTTVTATYDGVTLSCEIEACTLPVTTDVIEYESGNDYTVNLSKLDETKATLDWHYFGNGFTDSMKGGSLIGEITGERNSYFYDYRAKINWSNGTVRDSNFNDLTAGWTFKGSVSFTVTLTNKTDYIAIFTGAYHAKNTIEVQIGDKVHTVYEFSNRGDNDGVDKNKQFRIYPDVTEMAAAQTVTVTLTCGGEPDHGWADNISLVAIAVVGKDARTEKTAGTATAEATLLADAENKQVDLTEIGTLDWVYAKNGNGGLTRKAGVPANSIIKANEIVTWGGSGYDYFADGMRFKWTDGTEAVAEESINNFQWINNKYNIPVHLPQGENEVTLYLSGWKCSYFVTVLDGYGNKLIDAQKVVEGNGSSSQAVAVKITVNAAEASTFTFIMTRTGDGNHGWAAIAVAQKSEYSLVNSTFDVALGGTAAGKIEILKSGETTDDAATFASSNVSVVAVAADGTIMTVGKGTAVITVTVGGTEFYAYVTVTEYALDSSDSVVLPLDATSQIQVVANPEGAINASYSSSDEDIATVSESGLITGVAEGEVTITVTIKGKTFTVAVKVVEYKLNKSEVKLQAGEQTNGTQQLSVLDKEDAEVAEIVTYASENSAIATVSESGLVSAVGVGTTTISATTGDNVTLTCTVTVTIPDTDSVLTELDWVFENLSRVSSEYKTIDYKHWSNEDTVIMPSGASLIGEPSSTAGNFWDYKTTIGYEYTEGGRNLGKCYGKTSNGFELPVTINNTVSEVVFYTGAYEATATVTFKLDGDVIGSSSFTAGNSGIARKVSIKLDTSKMLEDATLTIVGEKEGSGNINVVAVAVVGKTAYSGTEIVAGTATAATQQLGDTGSNKVNLTEVGTLDWIYSHYENPSETTYRMFGGTVFTGESYYNADGESTSGSAQWDGRSAFMWTNGILTGSDATEGSQNPADTNNEGWDGHDEYTNNYNAASGEIHIAMHLTAGKYTITAYLNSWKADISAAIYDGNNNFVAGKIMVNNEPSGGSGWTITFELEVTAESTFNLVIGKSRSHSAGDRQVGWQAVAVAELPRQDEQS